MPLCVCVWQLGGQSVPLCVCVWQLGGQSVPLCVCVAAGWSVCASACVCVWQLGGQSVPLEVHLLKLVAHVEGVVQLLDYFDKPNSFVVVVDRKP